MIIPFMYRTVSVNLTVVLSDSMSGETSEWPTSGDESKSRSRVVAPISATDKWILFWLFVDALTHCVLEASFCILSLRGPIIESDSIFAIPCMCALCPSGVAADNKF